MLGKSKNMENISVQHMSASEDYCAPENPKRSQGTDQSLGDFKAGASEEITLRRG